MNSEQRVKEILTSAGITINGAQPWDIVVHDKRFYNRVLAQGSLGFGESYMDGWWDAEQLDETIARIVNARAKHKIGLVWQDLLRVGRAALFNLQTKAGSKKVAQQHYDLGNDLYMAFLDPYNQYTCGYFKDTADLNTAQEQKLDLICKKLQLKKTDRLLDIGCGWGGLAKFAAEKYGCHVTGISISQEQIAYARKITAGLPVEIINSDYRDLSGSFDKVVSVGMIEHVGHKNYRTMMKVVDRVLKPEGIFLLHTIGRNYSAPTADPWIEKYIFPNSMLPSLTQITKAFEKIFVLEDLHSFGPHYDLTLQAWWKNLEKNRHTLPPRYDERFYRMFRYYLLSCAGAFRARDIQLWQFVFTKNGVPGGYPSIR